MNARGEKFAQASRWMRVVLRSWGGRVSLKFGVHDVIVLFLFATMGFHIAYCDFLDPNDRAIRGLYCMYLLSVILLKYTMWML